MDELINQLNALDFNKEVQDESIDSICDSLSQMCKISETKDIEIEQEKVVQVVEIISKLSLNEKQIKKLSNIGILIGNLMRKIKCYEFPDAYAIPKYVC
jgi:hypothetical protein